MLEWTWETLVGTSMNIARFGWGREYKYFVVSGSARPHSFFPKIPQNIFSDTYPKTPFSTDIFAHYSPLTFNPNVPLDLLYDVWEHRIMNLSVEPLRSANADSLRIGNADPLRIQ